MYTPQTIAELEKVDISSHHSPAGKLYMPSYPWGINTFNHDLPPTNLGPNVSDSARTQTEAIEKAQKYYTRLNTSVLVFRRRDGKIIQRFVAKATDTN